MSAAAAALSQSARNKSKSLDKMFLEVSAATGVQDDILSKNNAKEKQKDQEGNFLSRLFGSKRLRMRTSVSKKDLSEEKRRGSGLGTGTVAVAPPPAKPEPAPAPIDQVSPPKHSHKQKQKPPPPPPPDTTPPPPDYTAPPLYHAPRPAPDLGVAVLPPLPSNKSDIILKKNTSLGALPPRHLGPPDTDKFHTSVHNWSLASEGRVKSMVSLSGAAPAATQAQSPSSESLATIAALLEEPEQLEHTSVREAADTEPRSRNSSQPTPAAAASYEGAENTAAAGEGDGGNDITAVEEVRAATGAIAVNASEAITLTDDKDECGPIFKTNNNETTGSDPSEENDLITTTDNEEQSSSSTEHCTQPAESIMVDEAEEKAEDDARDAEAGELSSCAPNMVTRPAPGTLLPTEQTIKAEHAPPPRPPLESDIFSEARPLGGPITSFATEKSPRSSHGDAVFRAIAGSGPGQDNNADGSCEEKTASKDPVSPPGRSDGGRTREDQPSEGDTANLDAARGESEGKDPLADKKPDARRVSEKPDAGRKKPEISPKPVPAPRTFFLRPKPDVSGGGGGGGPQEPVNELLNVFKRRSTSVSDIQTQDLAKLATTAPGEAGESQEKINVETKNSSSEVEINVKERAKSFSGLQSYNLGPKPFRPLSISPEKDPERQKPKISQKPIPAPRQFRSFPRLENLKTTQCTSVLERNNEQNKVLNTSDSAAPSNLENEKKITKEDEYNLDDIQVKKIADKFQKATPVKPARKSSPSSQDDDNPKKNVLNIVTKINSMAVL